MDEPNRAALAAWLAKETGVPVEITGMARLAGGAIQQNWSLDVVTGGVLQSWVLRADAPAPLSVSLSRVQEFALLRAAHAAGVTVPEPLFLCADRAVLGVPFLIMRRVEGIAAGHRVVRSERLGGGRAALTTSLGRELARIHTIRPPGPGLEFLPSPAPNPALRFVAGMRYHLDAAPTPRPMLEWGLRRLELTAPDPGEVVLCHNDFRTGNYMVTDEGITAVLDWEFAAWGDPHEDLGWLCAKCWRFGGPGEVAGIGSREDLYAAYQSESGRRVADARVRYWEIAATIRWAVVAIAQAQRHISGREPSLELALTGHIVPELELDVMRATLGGDA
jgi:aminoglycoside phosphotransferase (APT) family kinase protein